MEQDKLDNLFRNIIREDQSGLNKDERVSKEVIWNRLELPKKKSNFHFWKIAAAVLFLLLSATMALMLNNKQEEGERYSRLKMELEDTKNALFSLEEKLNESEKSFPEKDKSNIENPIVTTNYQASKEKEIIEKVVIVHDTIWIEKDQKNNQNVRLVRDTIFIKVPIKLSLIHI